MQAEAVYVSNEATNVVHVIDGASLKAVAQISVGRRPRGMAIDTAKKVMYVAVSNDNRIDVVDLRTRKVIGELPSGPDPEVIALHPDGAHIYVANEDDGLVSVVDIRAARVVATVPVGTEPEGMAISPDGRFAVCTSEASNMAHFIATGEQANSPKLLEDILVDTRPRYAAFTANSQRVWVSSEIRASIAVFDVATRRRIGYIDLARERPDLEKVQAVGIQITRDESRAFVALGRGNGVAEVDPRKFTVVRSFPAGTRVWNIALSTDESRLYAAAGISGDITAIDLRKNAVLGTIILQGKPWGIVTGP